jgi:hypothetical protein
MTNNEGLENVELFDIVSNIINDWTLIQLSHYLVEASPWFYKSQIF